MSLPPSREASPNCETSFDDIWSAFATKSELDAAFDGLSLNEAEMDDMMRLWSSYCRLEQRPPSDLLGPSAWTIWLILGGRGAGKTRTGAEWVRGVALGQPGFLEPAAGRIALVGETYAAVRDVMVEGPAGLLAIHTMRRERPIWSPSLRRLEWPNGAVAHAFSAEDPDALRGPQFGAAW